jgi:superfamily II DNA or RNA helicase
MTIPSYYRWGLSATPERKDGLFNVIQWHIGDIATVNDERDVQPRVMLLPTGVRLPKSRYQHGQNLILERLRTDLLMVDQRNEQILNELGKALDNDRKVIMLTDRLDHVDYLEQEVSERFTKSVGQLVGGMDEEERMVSKKCDVIIGTFGFIKEGVDIPDADTLFLLSPRSSVDQPVGRICREHDDKLDPVVVDFVDSMDIFKSMAGKRKRFYKNEDFDVVNKAGC